MTAPKFDENYRQYDASEKNALLEALQNETSTLLKEEQKQIFHHLHQGNHDFLNSSTNYARVEDYYRQKGTEYTATGNEDPRIGNIQQLMKEVCKECDNALKAGAINYQSPGYTGVDGKFGSNSAYALYQVYKVLISKNIGNIPSGYVFDGILTDEILDGMLCIVTDPSCLQEDPSEPLDVDETPTISDTITKLEQQATTYIEEGDGHATISDWEQAKTSYTNAISAYEAAVRSMRDANEENPGTYSEGAIQGVVDKITYIRENLIPAVIPAGESTGDDDFYEDQFGPDIEDPVTTEPSIVREPTTGGVESGESLKQKLTRLEGEISKGMIEVGNLEMKARNSGLADDYHAAKKQIDLTIAKIEEYNTLQTDDAKDKTTELTTLTQASETLQTTLDQINSGTHVTSEEIEEVINGGIDVEGVVEAMREEYKVGLVVVEIAKERAKFVEFIHEKIGNGGSGDTKEKASFVAGFKSLEQQVAKAHTVAKALAIWKTGMGNMLNNKWQIAEEFDKDGNIVKTGEKLDKFLVFKVDNRGDIKKYLNTIATDSIPAMAKRLALTDVVDMGISELPSFAGLDTQRKLDLGAWREAINLLDAQEKKVADARKKVIDLMDELNRLDAEERRIKGEISAESESIGGTSGGTEKSQYFKDKEAQQEVIAKRIAQLKDGVDTQGAPTKGEISRANDVLGQEKQKLATLKGDAANPGKERQKSETYAATIEVYGETTLGLVDTWKEKDMGRIEKELEANRILRAKLKGDLEKTKRDLVTKIQEIQDAIDANKPIAGLQQERDVLLTQKVQLEEDLAQLDFADRVAYQREYSTAHTALQAERNKLADDKVVLTEQLDTKKDRLTNALVGWSLAVKTQANAQILGITETKTDAEKDKTALAAEAWTLLADIYGGVAGIAEELTVNFPDGTQETWTVTSTAVDGQTLWKVGVKGSEKGIGIKKVPTESIDEASPSLYAQREFKTLQQGEIVILQALMTTWKDYVDAETRVYVLQQKIDIAAEDIQAWQEAQELYEQNLAEVDATAAEQFATDANITEKTYDGVVAAYDTLTTKYFTPKGDFNDFYWQETNSGDDTKIGVVKAELATRDTYKTFVDTHAPKVNTAKKMIEESTKRQAELTAYSTALTAQLTSNPNYEERLANIDTRKDADQAAIEGNTYWKLYQSDVTDPEGRANDTPVSDTPVSEAPGYDIGPVLGNEPGIGVLLEPRRRVDEAVPETGVLLEPAITSDVEETTPGTGVLLQPENPGTVDVLPTMNTVVNQSAYTDVITTITQPAEGSGEIAQIVLGSGYRTVSGSTNISLSGSGVRGPVLTSGSSIDLIKESTDDLTGEVTEETFTIERQGQKIIIK